MNATAKGLYACQVSTGYIYLKVRNIFNKVGVLRNKDLGAKEDENIIQALYWGSKLFNTLRVDLCTSKAN